MNYNVINSFVAFEVVSVEVKSYCIQEMKPVKFSPLT